MSPRLLRPNLFLDSVLHISPAELAAKGIKGLILDIDNTLVEWGKDVPATEVVGWFQAVRAEGIKTCIVSNNSQKRVEALAKALDLPAFCKARKPSRKAFRKAVSLMGTSAVETAVIGDQIFTDILGGNRLGLYTILVSPISRREFIGTRLVRLVERFVLTRILGKH
jgi:HAD superfamily phosphatase (TIGR01668 family)